MRKLCRLPMNGTNPIAAMLFYELEWALEMLQKEAVAKNSPLMSYLRGRADGILFCVFRTGMIDKEAHELIRSVITAYSEFGWKHERKH